MTKDSAHEDDPHAQALNAMYPPDWIRDTAQETGFVERVRTLDVVVFFWTLTLGTGAALLESLSQLKRGYEAKAGHTLSYGSWHPRFNDALATVLERCIARGIQHLAQAASEAGRSLQGKLAAFEDLLIQDSTIVRLHEKLADRWPAARSKTIAAGIKVNLLVSAVSAGPKTVAVVGERTPESKLLKIGSWVQDRILLLDLGYYKHHAFHLIDQQGGSFVSRLKDNANPTVTRLNKTVRGNSIDVVGLPIQEVLDRVQRQVLDVMVEVSFKKRAYKGTRSSATKRFRVVAVKNAETGTYHAYLTNLGEEFAADEVAALYGARWHVELVFKELKSRYALDKLKLEKAAAAKAVVYSCIVTLLASRRVYLVVVRGIAVERRVGYNTLRWSKVFLEYAAEIKSAIFALNGLAVDRGEVMRALLELQAVDPNKGRDGLLDPFVG